MSLCQRVKVVLQALCLLGPLTPVLDSLLRHICCTMQRKPRKHDHLIFYDSWVSRDLAGIPFANSRPFVLHQYSLARLQQGLPFPVSCCWNGMAVLNGSFFQQGYQFR